MEYLQLAMCALLAFSATAVLQGSAYPGVGSEVLELSPKEGGEAASAGPTEDDSLMLANRTDTTFVALPFHPKTAQPLKSKIKVDLSEERALTEPSFYVAAGDSTALWSCDSLEQYENYTLHLYRVPKEAQGVVQASLVRSVLLSPERIKAARRQRCRLDLSEQ